MGENVLIGKITIDCPVCGRRHELEERKRAGKIEIKGEKVTYDEYYLYCAYGDDDENSFATPSMLNDNLMRARDTYRTMHGLMTSGEIVALRESYGLSQVDLARLLGWGEATVSRYESKAIQDDAYDDMLRLIKENPLRAMDFLKNHAASFNEEKYKLIKNNIARMQKSYGDEYLSRDALRGIYVEYDKPSDLNGYRLLDIDKIEAVISYFAERTGRLYKVKLMNMLWYADAVSFKRTGRSITGLVYSHEVMGALPLGHYALMNLHRLNVCEELSAGKYLMIRIYPSEGMDYGNLCGAEKEILDEVILKFGDFNALDIIEYMHGEKAYTETEMGDIIPFSLAAGIRDFRETT